MNKEPRLSNRRFLLVLCITAVPGVLGAAALPLIDSGRLAWFAITGVLFMGLSCGIQADIACRHAGLTRRAALAPFLVATTFGLWGTVIVACSLGLLTPIACPLIWATTLYFPFGSIVWVRIMPLAMLTLLAVIVYAAWPPSGIVISQNSWAIEGVVWQLGHPLVMHSIARRRRALDVISKDTCHVCGYDLTGLPGTQCPECGIRFGSLVHEGDLIPEDG